MAVKKSTKRCSFVIYSYLKGIGLQELKRMQGSRLGA